jgi:hypothetical protein
MRIIIIQALNFAALSGPLFAGAEAGSPRRGWAGICQAVEVGGNPP